MQSRNAQGSASATPRATSLYQSEKITQLKYGVIFSDGYIPQQTEGSVFGESTLGECRQMERS
jgi:hypothetical protein